ncbi:MAG: GTPase ObgE [Flavobacteriaceae bacterium]|nr:MAG: GTPase ObgE [Flavobacteriaceae bacterium TMED220]|tara:strand:+ start:1160 stop:2164 length:1005 start_codon:yes stop_codon:yes gene_type:complete
MTEGNFVDFVKITISSGNGGKGSVHLRREKFITKGGPDGGDGGRGGNVIFRANSDLWTLYSFKFQKFFKAGHGGDGSKNQSSGKNGKDLYIDVPIGTLIKNSETNKLIFEISEKNKQEIILKGGIGGRGNSHFKTSTRQTPRYAQPGKKGIEMQITLELKLLADVGLVGFPNAGKSTLLSEITSAKPKIADYEFTTLKPNLGIVNFDDYRSFVMADIPGIIEGASDGKGLGHYFLRHIERNSILLYLIPIDSKNLKDEFNILQKELVKFNPELIDKQIIIAFTKCDLLDQELYDEYFNEIEGEFNSKINKVMISSFSKMGISRLKDLLWKKLNS